MERRGVFDTVAAQYDAIRSEYPAEVVQRVLNHAAVEPPGRLLEIGCGTGIATLPYAQRGYRIVGVEPGPNLAAIAQRKLAPYPLVDVVVSRFEDWKGDAARFDLIYSATAWHWVDPEVRYIKTARLLKPGATLALYAHWTTGVFEEGQGVYAKHLPEWTDRPPLTIEQRLERGTASLRGSNRFRDIETHRYLWTRRFTADEYIRLLGTHSDHATLPVTTRQALFADLHACIARLGGVIEREYATVLWLSRRA